MPSTISPNMSLVIPSAGTQPGPQYALDINNSLSILDAHDHTSGNGVQIPTAGINIDAALNLNDFGMEDVGQLKMTIQPSPLSGATFPGTLYVSGVDLYYNDDNGNQIQITSSGQVNTAAGNITGLAPPAAATYLPGSLTFLWQSNSGTNVPADLDAGSIVIRELVAGANGVTLSSPTGLGSDYTLTFPTTLPGTNNAITLLDSSGTISTLDKGSANEILRMDSSGTNLEYLPVGAANGVLKVNAAGTDLEYGLITRESQAVAPLSKSGALNTSTNSTSFVSVGTVTINNPQGRPIMVGLESNGAVNPGFLRIFRAASSQNNASGEFLLEEVGVGGRARFQITNRGDFPIQDNYTDFPPPGILVLDSAAGTGSITYELFVRMITSDPGYSISINNCRLFARML